MRRRTLFIGALLAGLFVPAMAWAQNAAPGVSLEVGLGDGSPEQVVSTVKIFLLLTLLSLAPAILLSMTTFTRFIIVLSFMRQSLGTQGMPPNQILLALALFLTFFVMAPVATQVNDNAIEPFMAGDIGHREALEAGLDPLRTFMLRQTRDSDLGLMLSVAKHPKPASADDVPTLTLVPAFIISELKTAFQMGFLLYVPFLVIDLVVASVLSALGMMMLPPVLISLPFKVMLFVLVDGWNLLIGSLVRSVA